MARRLLFTRSIPGKEIVMSSQITITLDEKGTATVSELPPGVFYSRFAAPPKAQIRDVISINSPGSYTIRFEGPGISDPSATWPVENPQPSEAIFFVDASNLPLLQEYGTAGCLIDGNEYILGVIVNPLNLVIPVAVDIDGEIAVDQADMPIGVHFNSPNHRFGVWGAGAYTFAFALPADGGRIFTGVHFENPPEMIDWEISADQLTFWVYNDYLKTNTSILAAPFTFEISNLTPNGIADITVDPTIINNPINQGGSGGGIPYPTESRPELAGVLVG
jgi:hypothetical protein